MKKYLSESLKIFCKSQRISFHTPGHKNKINRYDLTEIDGLDDLSNPAGIIKNSEERAAEVFGADRSFFLVNGSTVGNLALMASIFKSGDTVLVDRQCHKSIYGGLILTGVKPIYLPQSVDVKSGIAVGLDLDDFELKIKNNSVKAVIITSPNYDGVMQDLYLIRELCSRHNVIMLVDEAHGSHLYFSGDYKVSAAKAKADGFVNSAHKTLSSLTQTSLLHIIGDKVDGGRVKKYLNILQTSSPSYILMKSLDDCILEMQNNGEKIVKDTVKVAKEFTARIKTIPGIEVFDGEYFNSLDKKPYDFDVTKVNISALRLGYTGFKLKELLFKEGIDVEKADLTKITLLISHENVASDFDNVYNYLKGLKPFGAGSACIAKGLKIEGLSVSKIPEAKLTPKEAFDTESETIKAKEAEGRISAEIISISPPGIPVIVPGEIIDRNIIKLINKEYIEVVRIKS